MALSTGNSPETPSSWDGMTSLPLLLETEKVKTVKSDTSTAEATEDAVLNAMTSAETMKGPHRFETKSGDRGIFEEIWKGINERSCRLDSGKSHRYFITELYIPCLLQNSNFTLFNLILRICYRTTATRESLVMQSPKRPILLLQGNISNSSSITVQQSPSQIGIPSRRQFLHLCTEASRPSSDWHL